MATTPVRAQRRRAPLKLALMGPSGSGKTWSALLIAQGIGPRILVIDTENHSSELYDHLCPFDTVPIEEPYSVLKLIDELKAHAKNYDVIIIDTMSKFWNGKGGLLEMQEVEARRSGNKWTAWAPVTELYNDLVEELINSKVHVIGTSARRRKRVAVCGLGMNLRNWRPRSTEPRRCRFAKWAFVDARGWSRTIRGHWLPAK
jgi:hypothetical protein